MRSLVAVNRLLRRSPYAMLCARAMSASGFRPTATAVAHAPPLLCSSSTTSSSTPLGAAQRAFGRPKTTFTGRKPRLTPLGAGKRIDFLADENVTFPSLGFPPAVADSLSAAGFARPSKVQELSAPALLDGRNVVLAAETGSGKTLAYVAPIAARLLADLASFEGLDPKVADARKSVGLVLCPNSALCQQVAALANSLRAAGSGSSGDGGAAARPLLRAVHVSTASPPPFETPDLVVATPAGLATLLKESGDYYGRLWTWEGLERRVKYVVVDEADLQLAGGTRKELRRIFENFRLADRERQVQDVLSATGMSRDDFERMPLSLRRAAKEGGMAGLTAAGYKPRANSAAGAGSSSRVQPLYVEPPQDQLPYHERQQPYWARQYVFVGATMPALTKRDAGSEIEDLVPGSEWLTTDGLHRIKPEVSHAWVEVAAEEEGADGAAEGGRGRSGWGHALLAAIRNDPDYPAGRAKILVFADDKESADAVSGLLAEEALPHVLYHKGVNAYERAQALEAAVRSDSVVMVSTDAAARGIDIPGVTHVIQAQFAANAVDFLHRVGRTARAGQRGKVTSLFAASDLPLVNVLRDYVSRGVPLEGAFSRSRSFSRRLKRTGGEFVPRGLTRTEFLAEAAGATPAGGGSAAAGADAAELKPAA